MHQQQGNVRERPAEIPGAERDNDRHHTARDARIQRQPERADRTEPCANRGKQLHVARAETSEREGNEKRRGSDQPAKSGAASAGPAASDSAVDQPRGCRAKSEHVRNTAAADVGDAGDQAHTHHHRRLQRE